MKKLFISLTLALILAFVLPMSGLAGVYIKGQVKMDGAALEGDSHKYFRVWAENYYDSSEKYYGVVTPGGDYYIYSDHVGVTRLYCYQVTGYYQYWGYNNFNTNEATYTKDFSFTNNAIEIRWSTSRDPDLTWENMEKYEWPKLHDNDNTTSVLPKIGQIAFRMNVPRKIKQIELRSTDTGSTQTNWRNLAVLYHSNDGASWTEDTNDDPYPSTGNSGSGWYYTQFQYCDTLGCSGGTTQDDDKYFWKICPNSTPSPSTDYFTNITETVLEAFAD